MAEDEMVDICEYCGCGIDPDDGGICADCASLPSSHDKASAMVGLDGWSPADDDFTVDQWELLG
jgi:hypothetical protein